MILGNAFFGDNTNDTGGIRAYDGGHVIRNNYIDSVKSTSNTRAGIVIHSGVNAPGTNTTLNAQWTPYNLLIENNTIVNSTQSILFDGKYTYAAEDIFLINNLIIARPNETATRYDKMPINAIFTDNHFYSDKGYSSGIAGVTIPDGVIFESVLLELEPNENGMKLHDTYGAKNVLLMTDSNTGINWII